MKRGFTLVEILVSITIFLVVMTVAMGSVVSIINTNRKVGISKALMDNLNFAMESISREIRFGKNYHCITAGDSGPYSTTQNCPSGGTAISFYSQEGAQVIYRLNGTAIEVSTDNGTTYIPITSPEVIVQDLTFYVVGANPPPGDTLQPRVIIRLKGLAGTGQNQTYFALETQVSQRELDHS